MSELLKFLIDVKNINYWDRSPAISDEELDRLIKVNLGEYKVFRISYSFNTKRYRSDYNNNMSSYDNITTNNFYVVGKSESEEKIQEVLNFYRSLNFYDNITVEEAVF